jgi:transcriptional regulator with XRE-family HTH domain
MDHVLYVKNTQNFGANLKYLRIKRGLSLAKLSEAINIPKGTLSVYECSYNLCSVDRMKKIAKFYGLADYMCLLMDHEEFVRKA